MRGGAEGGGGKDQGRRREAGSGEGGGEGGGNGEGGAAQSGAGSQAGHTPCCPFEPAHTLHRLRRSTAELASHLFPHSRLLSALSTLSRKRTAASGDAVDLTGSGEPEPKKRSERQAQRQQAQQAEAEAQAAAATAGQRKRTRRSAAGGSGAAEVVDLIEEGDVPQSLPKRRSYVTVQPDSDDEDAAVAIAQPAARGAAGSGAGCREAAADAGADGEDDCEIVVQPSSLLASDGLLLASDPADTADAADSADDGSQPPAAAAQLGNAPDPQKGLDRSDDEEGSFSEDVPICTKGVASTAARCAAPAERSAFASGQQHLAVSGLPSFGGARPALQPETAQSTRDAIAADVAGVADAALLEADTITESSEAWEGEEHGTGTSAEEPEG